MRTWIGGIAATAVTVGALVVSSGTALADTPAGSNATVCTVRIPALLKKIDTVTAKIDGDATTKGSTAWLQAREDKARAAGRTAAADLLQNRITDRAQRLTELTQVRNQVLAVQGKDCGK